MTYKLKPILKPFPTTSTSHSKYRQTYAAQDNSTIFSHGRKVTYAHNNIFQRQIDEIIQIYRQILPISKTFKWIEIER